MTHDCYQKLFQGSFAFLTVISNCDFYEHYVQHIAIPKKVNFVPSGFKQAFRWGYNISTATIFEDDTLGEDSIASYSGELCSGRGNDKTTEHALHYLRRGRIVYRRCVFLNMDESGVMRLRSQAVDHLKDEDDSCANHSRNLVFKWKTWMRGIRDYRSRVGQEGLTTLNPRSGRRCQPHVRECSRTLRIFRARKNGSIYTRTSIPLSCALTFLTSPNNRIARLSHTRKVVRSRRERRIMASHS